MKKITLPDSLKKRKLLFDQKVPVERLIATGEAFLQADRVYEAAELFRKAAYQEGMAKLRQLAVEQGDSLLLDIAIRKDPDGNHRDAWQTLAVNAMEQGKYTHAIRAFEKAGDSASMKRAQEALKEVIPNDKT